MRIIDAHLHASFYGPTAAAFRKEFGRKSHIDFSWAGLQRELDSAGAAGAVIIAGSAEFGQPTPTGLDWLSDLAEKDARLFPVVGVNPGRVNRAGIERLRKAFRDGIVHGIKIFPSYYPRYATDRRYERFYRLAAEHGRPVIIHTGDTFGNEHLVKYAHPLQVDELAVRFRKTQFIIAHMGNPWVRDAAEVVYKNPNVSVDLSGLCIGSPLGHLWPSFIQQDLAYAFAYVDDPAKFLYGTDWPLVRMREYRDFLMRAVPRKHHRAVFFDNAKRLFQLPV
jgi:hypothetical protein